MTASEPRGKPSRQRPPGRPAGALRDGMRYPIPASSARAFARRDQNKPQNPGLIFDRFAPDWRGESTLKKEALESVCQAAERADGTLRQAWQARWDGLVRAANAEPFPLKTDWRFIAGLGRKGSLEVGFTFHRYGFPILPGSSVKGVARAWALIQIAEQLGTCELKGLDQVLSADGDEGSKERKQYEAWRTQQPEAVQGLAEDFRTVFGTTAAAGQAVFFDAIPADKLTLELDVMNPHYPQYYTGDQFPTDWQSPVPVYFLTVAPGTRFLFAVGWRGPLDDEARRLRGLAETWLREGLKNLGAGAKTSAGYGYFSLMMEEKPAEPARPSTARGISPKEEPLPKAPEVPPAWRTGTVREYRPDKGQGRLVDDETGEEFTFRREAIEEKGWSPGKKAKVQFAVAEDQGGKRICKLRKA